jgi:group II intron reverse transcriptase/maturase
VRQAARQGKDVRFTALLHHITVDLLQKSYFALKRQSAAGIDGMNWQTYGENLTENLTALHSQIHKGSYRAKPARRTLIPKADGTQRPLSILCLEDKIAQQAVVYVLEAIYEECFLGFSYGFRSGRSPHDALDALSTGLYRKRVNWVLDADIQKFFDTMNHDWMMQFLQHQIGDKRLLRLVAKWLKVGVMNGYHRESSEQGAAQGAVISPILANVYLHYVLDLWCQRWRRREACGDMIVIRYADDSVYGFEHEHEAKQFLQDVRERLTTFGLTLHPDKTRLIRFGRHAMGEYRRFGLPKPGTFDFLGFTHYCTVTRQGNDFVIGRKTIKKRLRSTLQKIKVELRRRWHDPISKTGEWIRKVLQGHLNYFAVSGNQPSLWIFLNEVSRLWLHRLRTRSQKGFISWKTFTRLTKRFYPPIRVLHPFPRHRFDARTRGRSPVR